MCNIEAQMNSAGDLIHILATSPLSADSCELNVGFWNGDGVR